MTHYPYLLFHQTPESLRRIGSRGGKAQARNRRARLRDQAAVPAPAIAGPEPPVETAAAAMAALDARFPWLSGCAFGSPKVMKTRRSSSKAESPSA